MKLRLLDDSIRLRLSRGDVLAAAEQGVVEGQTRFPDGSAFKFALETLSASSPRASFAGGRMVVSLPSEEILSWANDDAAVSIQCELQLPDGSMLNLLVEKDFKCLTGRPEEDQSDMFQNPDSTAC